MRVNSNWASVGGDSFGMSLMYHPILTEKEEIALK